MTRPQLDGLDSSHLAQANTDGAALHAVSADTATHADQADNATNASNADTVDGKHAADFAAATHNHDDRYYTETESDGRYLRKCQNGTVYGRAEIRADIIASSATSTLSTTGVNHLSDFICTGENVQVKRQGVGSYEVVFGDVNHSGFIGLGNSGGPLPVVSSSEVGINVSASGPSQCATTPPPYIICYQVKVTDSSDTYVDRNFNIAIM